MSTVNITHGQSAYIDPQIEYADSGWVVDGVYATHYPCFAGAMDYIPDLPLTVGVSYDFTYVIDNYISGSVKTIFGGTSGTSHTSNGTFTDTFEYTGNESLQFYSDGGLRLELLSVTEHQTEAINNANTFAFHEKANRWVENYSWAPECMINFGKRFFTMLNGELWEHDTNPIAGKFYNTKYPAQIDIVVNNEYEKDKLWYNLRLDAKGQWYLPSIVIPPSNQFPNGMFSTLKKNNVKLIDGKLWGAFLRDLNDPNFVGQPEALTVFNARQLQGGVMVLRLECNDDGESNISSAEFYYTDVERSI